MPKHIIKNIDVGKINKNEIFALDTNVLVWMFYTSASNPALNIQTYQLGDYSNFVGNLLQNGNEIVTSSLNITEACVVIERNERDIYDALNNTGKQTPIKKYRKMNNCRKQYQKEMNCFIQQIKSNIRCMDINVDMQDINGFISGLSSINCDVFDYMISAYYVSQGITRIISDDKDYANLTGVDLYTSYP